MAKVIPDALNNLEHACKGPKELSFNAIKDAVPRIADGIINTPICEAKITKFKDYNIYLKCENLQYTGSFAERGVLNALKCTSTRSKGVIVAASEDMALAASYHGHQLKIPVTVVLPEWIHPATAQRCSDYGSEVFLYGNNYNEAMSYGEKLLQEGEKTLLRSDDPVVMAGFGTVGLEILNQIPDTDAVIVPVGDGSLLAGVLTAVKHIKPSCLVYGVECSKVPKMMKALQTGKPYETPIIPNIAEGLNYSSVGQNAFLNIKGKLDRMLEVEEMWIARTTVAMLEQERLVADGAGVCAFAAVLQGLVPELRGKRTVCVVSSGNTYVERLTRIIHRGLGASGRLIRFSVALPDHCGGLESLSKAIQEENAVLKSIFTEQIWVLNDVGSTWANVVVETANDEHSGNFRERIRSLYPSARFLYNSDPDTSLISKGFY